MNEIAILDPYNQDISLKILFPEADYYIIKTQIDRQNSYKRFNFQPLSQLSNLEQKKYDYLFVILPLLDIQWDKELRKIVDSIVQLTQKKSFKKVFWFNNSDYDYDPFTLLSLPKNHFVFKRNYSKKIKYDPRVFSYPFIMFGSLSLLEKILDRESFKKKKNSLLNFSLKPFFIDLNTGMKEEVYFSGALFNHVDKKQGIERNREKMFRAIEKEVYMPKKMLPYDKYMLQMSRYKLSLDLLGAGDPNKRTFEILCSGSLKIAQETDLKWPFSEDFHPETIFTNPGEFFQKLKQLKSNNQLYNECLQQQEAIYQKYFNSKWLKNYIQDHF